MAMNVATVPDIEGDETIRLFEGPSSLFPFFVATV